MRDQFNSKGTTRVGRRPFPRSRHFQSRDRDQRCQGCAAPAGLDLDASARRGRKMAVGYQANFLRRGHRYPRPLSGGSAEGPTSLRQTCLSVSSRLLVGASAEFGEGGAWFVLGGFTRVQFSPPHRKPRKHPCTRKILELTKLILAE